MDPKEQIYENIVDTLENGPGLRYDRHSPMLATCKAEKRAILGGLGSMGFGIMSISLRKTSVWKIPKKCPDFPTLQKANDYVIKEYGRGAIDL